MNLFPTRALARSFAVATCAAGLLSACETLQPAPAKPTQTPAKPATPPASPKPPVGSPGNPAPVALPVNTEQQSLKEGIDLYNKGSYNEAIKRLNAPEVTGGSRSTQLKALKFTAFSYCLTSRTTLCRATFDKAFKLDPAFALDAGENGHPLWMPSFTRAKKAAPK